LLSVVVVVVVGEEHTTRGSRCRTRTVVLPAREPRPLVQSEGIKLPEVVRLGGRVPFGAAGPAVRDARSPVRHAAAPLGSPRQGSGRVPSLEPAAGPRRKEASGPADSRPATRAPDRSHRRPQGLVSSFKCSVATRSRRRFYPLWPSLPPSPPRISSLFLRGDECPSPQPHAEDRIFAAAPGKDNDEEEQPEAAAI